MLQELKWRMFVEENTIVFILFGENFEVKKRVFVSESLLPKIYLGSAEIRHEFEIKETSDMKTILQMVDDIRVCPGASTKNFECRGFLSGRSQKCEPCIRQARRRSSCQHCSTVQCLKAEVRKFKKKQ